MLDFPSDAKAGLEEALLQLPGSSWLAYVADEKDKILGFSCSKDPNRLEP